MRLIGSKWSWAPVAALAAAFPLLAVQAQSTPPVAGPAAVPPAVSADLPDGPGKAQIMADCAACHAPTIVASERHTADEWSAIIAVMVDRGAQVSDADNAAITAYLAKNYGKAAGAPTG